MELRGRGQETAPVRLSPRRDPAAERPGPGRRVLARRSLADPTDLAYSIPWAGRSHTGGPGRGGGRSWVIEAGFQRAKGKVGLDQYEARRWEVWHRPITLGLLALAFLAVPRATAIGGKGGAPPRAPMASSP